MKKKSLKKLRGEIDNIDSKIITLLNKRGRISVDIGGIKQKKNQQVYAPEREQELYETLTEKNSGPIKNEALKNIYREVMSACRSLEKPLKVAFLGPEITFTHQVAVKRFGLSVEYISCDNISDVFIEVEKGNADYGVVPVENSIEGAVNHTMDMFVDADMVICSEIYLKVKQCLLSKSTKMDGIKKIYSHPQVFGQCRIWLEKNMPKVKLIDQSSTVRAAEKASKDKQSACISSELALSKYPLNVLAKSIEDSRNNVTRFLVIGKKMSAPSGNDKTSIVFSVKDKPGILHDMLSSFKEADINLTKIESRPSKLKAWKYYFFIDMEGHSDNKKLKEALEKIEKKCNFLKILGSYPKG